MNTSIDEVVHGAVERGDAPFVVAMAADEHGVIYEAASGNRRADGDDPVTADSMMRIASMTKMVTTVAALQQMEQGHLELDAPVENYCPEFGAVPVLDGFDGVTPRLRPSASPASVRQLMSHTSGLSYWFWNANIF